MLLLVNVLLVEVATNVVGILGGVGSNVSREYDVTTTPVKYTEAVMDTVAKTNNALLGKMKTLR